MADTREKLIELTAKHQQEADKLSDAAKTSFGDNRTVSVFKWMHSLAAAHKEFVAELDEVSTLLENGVTVQKCARPIEEWGEDYGDVLWWKFPIEEPPYVGSPLDEKWPGYHTHWTPIPMPEPPKGE